MFHLKVAKDVYFSTFKFSTFVLLKSSTFLHYSDYTGTVLDIHGMFWEVLGRFGEFLDVFGCFGTIWDVLGQWTMELSCNLKNLKS